VEILEKVESCRVEKIADHDVRRVKVDKIMKVVQ
jgi:hypothetical protein